MKTFKEEKRRTSDLNAKYKLGLENLKPVKPICKHSVKPPMESRGIQLSSHAALSPTQLAVTEHRFPVSPADAQSLQAVHKSGPPLHSSCLPQKFKLQLFPLDDSTRNVLQQASCNPYLELTLTNRKKISSVVRHINEKWGHLRPNAGELMLFPDYAKHENPLQTKRWTLNDSSCTAADVHAAVGRPTTFRLRYGWLTKFEGENHGRHNYLLNQETARGVSENVVAPMCEEKASCGNIPLNEAEALSRLNAAKRMTDVALSNEEEISFPSNMNSGGLPKENPNKIIAASWLDSLSNISFGALLSEVLPSQGGNSSELHKSYSGQLSITCDSFDAAIASFRACQQVADGGMKAPSHSIWDAEVTCQPFHFQASVGESFKDAPINSHVV